MEDKKTDLSNKTKGQIEEEADKKESQPEAVLEALDFRTGLGIRFLECKAGYAKGEMDILPCHLNVLGVIHGGCLFSLADTISGTAVVGHGHRVTTVNGSINYLRAGKNTSKIIAEAKEVKYGRTFSVCEAQIFDDKGTLLAITTMTFFHLGEEK